MFNAAAERAEGLPEPEPERKPERRRSGQDGGGVLAPFGAEAERRVAELAEVIRQQLPKPGDDTWRFYLSAVIGLKAAGWAEERVAAWAMSTRRKEVNYAWASLPQPEDGDGVRQLADTANGLIRFNRERQGRRRTEGELRVARRADPGRRRVRV